VPTSAKEGSKRRRRRRTEKKDRKKYGGWQTMGKGLWEQRNQEKSNSLTLYLVLYTSTRGL